MCKTHNRSGRENVALRPEISTTKILGYCDSVFERTHRQPHLWSVPKHCVCLRIGSDQTRMRPMCSSNSSPRCKATTACRFDKSKLRNHRIKNRPIGRLINTFTTYLSVCFTIFLICSGIERSSKVSKTIFKSSGCDCK